MSYNANATADVLEAREIAAAAVHLAEHLAAQISANQRVYRVFVAMVREGRDKGVSPARLVDAMIKDLTNLSSGDPADLEPSSIRAVSDVVYGVAATDRTIREEDEAMLALLKTLRSS